MPSRPWYKWFPADYMADTLHLTLEQDAAYRRLLDLLWQYESLPADPGSLSKLLRIHGNKWRHIWPYISPYISIDNEGRIYHPKMRAQLAQATEVKEKRAEAGQKGGLAKAKANATNARASQIPDPETTKETPPSGEQRKAAATRGSRLPQDWRLPEEWERWASAHLPLDEVRRQAEIFRDHWHSAPGQKGVKVNWLATWRNWIRRSAEKRDNGTRAHRQEQGGDGYQDRSLVGKLERRAGRPWYADKDGS